MKYLDHERASPSDLPSVIEELMRKAETGADWAEIARLEAVMLGGTFFATQPLSSE